MPPFSVPSGHHFPTPHSNYASRYARTSPPQSQPPARPRASRSTGEVSRSRVHSCRRFIARHPENIVPTPRWAPPRGGTHKKRLRSTAKRGDAPRRESKKTPAGINRGRTKRARHTPWVIFRKGSTLGGSYLITPAMRSTPALSLPFAQFAVPVVLSVSILTHIDLRGIRSTVRVNEIT